MASFTIYKDGAIDRSHVASVQTDGTAQHPGTFEVVGDVHNPRTVHLNFARVHVSGGVTQAPTYTGANGHRLEVRLVNNTVRIQPVP